MLTHDARQRRRGQRARAEGIHQHRNRLSHADRVSQLHFHFARQLGRDNVLRDVASRVASRAVHLGRVLAGERAAAMPAHAAIRVHDDLAAR